MGLNWEANLKISILEIRKKNRNYDKILKDAYSLNYDEKLNRFIFILI